MYFESLFFLVSAFKAIFHAHSGIRRHHLSLVWRSEPLYIVHSGTLSLHLSVLLMIRVTSPPLYHSESQFPSIHIHWHCPLWLSWYHTYSLFFLTWLPCAYRLFVIVLPDFPPHCSWHDPLSLWYVFLSCYWAPYTCCFHVVRVGQSPLDAFFHVLQSGSTVTHLGYGLSSHFWRHLRESLGPQCDFRDILRHPSLLGLEPRCPSVSLSEFVFHQCPYGGLLGSSVESTSFHSLFTLSFHSSVHVFYIRELY